MDEREPDLIIVERYYKRLTDSLQVSDKVYDGTTWWLILIPVLAIGAIFITWMYAKDSKSIRWYFSVPLALMRATVYGLLAYMFLLPTIKETRIWKPAEPPTLMKESRVVVLFDISDSMAKISDDSSSQAKRRTRLQKVIEYVSDEHLAFMKKLLENNPVYVYRFGTRLDNEVNSFKQNKALDDNGQEKAEMRPFVMRRVKDKPGMEEQTLLTRWNEQDWKNFSEYTDFRSWTVRGLSDKGREAIEKEFPDITGDDGKSAGFGIDWAQGVLAAMKGGETLMSRLKLSEEDATVFRGNVNSMDSRLSIARTITQGTNVTESVQAVYEAEKDNKLEGIIVFSDGRSNIGVDSRLRAGKEEVKISPLMDDLHRSAKKDGVVIIVVGVGEHRVVKGVRITDLQTPDQSPPDDAFKVIVEIDGENLPGEAIDVFLELTPPQTEVPIVLPGKVTFDRSEPPHGQFEWTINPPDINKLLPEDLHARITNPKEMINGVWKARAFTAKLNDEGKPIGAEKIYSEVMPIKVEQKSVRILLMGSVANRDFQFLLTQLIRDKAEVSVVLQNDAGQFLDGKSISFLDDKFRHLTRFPDRLNIEEDPTETPETKWMNLSRYDAIIAFDPDWSLITEEQAANIQKWVDLQAGGLLHIGGPVNTKKLTWSDNTAKLQPLLEIFPVILGDYDLKMANRDRNKPRRLEFPGASPEMEFLRLDDDEPDNTISGWETFFTGKKTREAGAGVELKRGFFDYYPVKDVKAGATVVARYIEPLASDNTFDHKDPPYIVAYKYGQGWTAFLGSSEIWRFRQAKDVYFERFWVKMSRFLASGSRKKQNRRGRILMSKTFSTGDYLRLVVHELDANLKGLPDSANPVVTVRPVELLKEAGWEGMKKKDSPAGKKDGESTPMEGGFKSEEEYLKSLTRELKLSPRTGPGAKKDEGYFQLQKMLTAKDFPPGIWHVDAKIPNSSESLSEKFIIRKAQPAELTDTKPDLLSLAAIASEVSEINERLQLKKPEVLEKLKARSFSSPSIAGQRLAYKFDDRQSLELIPEVMRYNSEQITNPQTEPEIQKVRIEPSWFNGPELPEWMTRWFDKSNGESQKSHSVALWMLVCIALLSLEWLTRKLLKLA